MGPPTSGSARRSLGRGSRNDFVVFLGPPYVQRRAANVSETKEFKVIAVGDRLGGKAITGLNFSRSGLSGDPVAFQATFSDGSQGVYSVNVVSPPSELRITAVSISGRELRFSFTASSGQSYVVESRADLARGGWAEVPGTRTTSSGAARQLVLPIALALPQQFYRVQQLP